MQERNVGGWKECRFQFTFTKNRLESVKVEGIVEEMKDGTKLMSFWIPVSVEGKRNKEWTKTRRKGINESCEFMDW